MHQPREQEEHPARAADDGRANEIRADIDRTLQRRSAHEGTWKARAEDRLKRRGAWVWRGMKKRPSIGVIAAGGAALLLADAVGVGELAMAIGIGYAAYQVLRKGTPVDEALREGEDLVRK
jgi:hypothetical protein